MKYTARERRWHISPEIKRFCEYVKEWCLMQCPSCEHKHIIFTGTTDVFNFKKVTKNIFSEIIPALLHVFKGFTRSEFKWENYSLWDASRPVVIHMLETTLCYSFIIHLLLFAAHLLVTFCKWVRKWNMWTRKVQVLKKKKEKRRVGKNFT